MKVPFIDLLRFEPGFLSEWQDKVQLISKSAAFIGGAEVFQLEESLKTIAGVKHAITCANGTDAIQLALRALGIGNGDLVVIPDLTFWATFEAVVNVGARPVTVDSDLKDGGVKFKLFKDAINKYAPKAAIIAHLYGWGSKELSEIRQFCKDQQVLLIEDGAQSFGSQFLGEPIYKSALVSTTSFYPAKVLGAAGDGGAVFTNNNDLADRLRQLANHGRSAHYDHGDVGWNSRLDALQAAFLNLALKYLPQRIASRREAVSFYNTQLPSLGISQINAPSEYIENGYLNVCLIENKEIKLELESFLKKQDIGYGNVYPSPMSMQSGALNYLYAHIGDGSTKHLCNSVLNLPIFPYMEEDELGFVIQSLESFFNNR